MNSNNDHLGNTIFLLPFQKKKHLSDCRAEILVLGRLDGLLSRVNNSFWDKLPVSIRYFLRKFSDCFSELYGGIFVLISKRLILAPCSISSDFLRSFENRSINFVVMRRTLVIIFSKRLS